MSLGGHCLVHIPTGSGRAVSSSSPLGDPCAAVKAAKKAAARGDAGFLHGFLYGFNHQIW